MRATATLPAIFVASAVLLLGGWWLTSGSSSSGDRHAAGATATSTIAASKARSKAPSSATFPAAHPTKTRSLLAPYALAPARLERLARGFVGAGCAYDARRETRLGFLARTGRYATPDEQRRLRHSERARLPWPMLRERGERVHIEVTGVSLVKASHADTDTRAPGVRRLVVEAIATTHTDFAVLHSFEQVTLRLTRTRAGWRVAAAVGAGL